MSIVRSALGLLLLAGLFGVFSEGQLAQRAHAGTQPSVSLRPTSLRVDHSEGEFTVRIELDNFEHHGRIPYDDDEDDKPDRFEPSDGLGAYEMYLYYDPGVVRVAGWESGDFVRRGRRANEVACLQREVDAGLYVMGCASMGSAAGPQGSGLLGTVRLEPLASGATDLDLEVELAGPLGDSIPTIFSRTHIEVVDAPQDAPPEPVDRPPPPRCNDCVFDGDGSLVSGNPRSARVEGASVLPGSTSGSNQAGSNSATTGTSGTGSPSGNAAGSAVGAQGAAGPNGFGRAGTGYQPSEGSWPVALAGAFVLVGLTLLLTGSPLAARSRRP